jgi:hypothetical protein
VSALLSPIAYTSLWVSVATAPWTALAGHVQRGSRDNALRALREHEQRRSAVELAWAELEPAISKPISPDAARHTA